MQYLYIDITITPFSESIADIVTAFLGEIGFDSFEQTETGINAYIKKDDLIEETLISTLDDIAIPDVSFSYTIHEMENKDWNEEWEKNNFDPVLEREFGIKLNPRMAFGSGSHDTTYTISSILLNSDFTNQRVLDMGTGTGVLGIAMAKRFAKEVVAIDIDEFSVLNAKENYELNGINNVSILLGDASAIEGTFDTIVANIHKNILIADMPLYVSHLAKKGAIYLSGFFVEDVPDMISNAEKNGLSLDEIAEKNGWAILKFTKQ